jgi:DNA-binding SARP family transcriptional activator
MLAVSAEPLRESAQLALLRAHVAEGNLVEARRGCRTYCDLLRRELGVEPSTELLRFLVQPDGRQPPPRRSHRQIPEAVS